MLATVLNFTAAAHTVDLAALPGFPPGHYAQFSGEGRRGENSLFVPALPTEAVDAEGAVLELEPFEGVLLHRE